MKILVLGAGLQGTAAAFDLLRNPAITSLSLADRDERRLEKARERLGEDPRLELHELDVGQTDAVTLLMRDHDACLAAVHFTFNMALTQAAIETGTHFCDLGGNSNVVLQQLKLDSDAFGAGITVIPDCGLAPGMANVMAAHGIRKLDEVSTVRIRVGGVPQEPKPPLGYQLLFAVEGLLHEYAERAIIVRDGLKLSVEPLTEVEDIEFPEPFGKLEAFHTAGGLSTLPRTFAGKVRNMDYKTIRYPGHCARMRPLYELGFFGQEPLRVGETEIKPREFTARFLETLLTGDAPDVVLLRISVQGLKYGGRRRLEYELVDRYDPETKMSAMMRCTAYPASIVLQMLATGRIDRRGVVPGERCVPADELVEELAKRGIHIAERQS